MKKNEVIIVNFGAFGDVINSTPIAKQYSLEGNKVIFVTRKNYSDVLMNNNYIDKICCFEEKINLNNVAMTHSSKNKIEHIFKGKKIIYSAPYMSPKYDGTPRSNLLSVIKDETSQVDEWLCDFIPHISLSGAEENEAAVFFKSIPDRKTILIEYEYYSNQSYLTFGMLSEAIENIKGELNLIFTGKEFPREIIKMQEKYENLNFYHYDGSFMSNAKLYNLCDVFIGVSSGLTCLTSSDYCKSANTIRIECCRGEHWSSKEWKHNWDKKTICYSYEQFLESFLEYV